MNQGQQRAYNLALSGHNIFITGSAGTGKSFLLKEIIKGLQIVKTVAVTASTGTAAHLINGITLHSWLGMGLAKEPVDILVNRIKRYSTCSENIRKTQVLIIDEISQVRGEFLDKIDACCQKVRRNGLPFGGIQVIICGDFAQLPPVMGLDIERELDESYSPTVIGDSKPKIDYAFKSDVWHSCNMTVCYLKEIMRQKDDPVFINVLNHLREGRITDEIFQPLLACIGKKFSNPTDNSHNIFPTRLVPTNAEAYRINQSFYSAIQGEEHIYCARFRIKRKRKAIKDEDYETKIVNRMLEYTKNHCIMETRLPLKIGTRVILTQNINVKLGLFNGAQAIVENFVRLSDAPSLDIEIATPSNRTIEEPIGVYDTDIVEEKERSSMSVPVIRLVEDDKLYALTPNTIEVRSDFTDEPNYLIVMSQYPLKHAWALTIHKSQGMTLERALIDAGRFIFSPGQTYTALSRVRSLAGLALTDFEPNKVLVDESVVEFYRSLSV